MPETKTCNVCHGSGEVTVRSIYYPNQKSSTHICPWCFGKKTVPIAQEEWQKQGNLLCEWKRKHDYDWRDVADVLGADILVALEWSLGRIEMPEKVFQRIEDEMKG